MRLQAAKLRRSWIGKHLNVETKTDELQVAQKVFMDTLFSPANLYITYPENRHIGVNPTTENTSIKYLDHSILDLEPILRAMVTATVGTMSMINIDIHVGNSGISSVSG
jgi:hypothetical protein